MNIHTSIRSLLAPSEMAARLSYCSGSKSLRAEVRYSPAGVFYTLSRLGLTKATVPSVLSEAKGKVATSPEGPFTLVLSVLCRKIEENLSIKNHK